MKKIPYGRQFIDNRDKKSVVKSLFNEFITTGSQVTKFEKKLNGFFKSKFSYVCNSGTSAIHLAMLSINSKKNDIVLMPSINFIASYNIAKTLGLKVYLVDVDENTGQITPNKVLECIKKNHLKKVKALIVMHHGGYPQYLKDFYDIKKKYDFYLIEDACHALGSEYKYKNKFLKIGSCVHSDISTFSLHPLKTITTGEGGIITTNNSKIAKKIKLFRSHGISKDKKKYWDYDVLINGFNYRLSDINCALGISQLNKIDFFIQKRKEIYDRYVKEFKNFNPNLKIPKYSKEVKFAYHLFTININFKSLNKNKDHFMKYLKEKNIFAQYHYIPIYKFSVYEEKLTNMADTEKYFKNTVSLPIFVNLNYQDQKKIINTIKRYFKLFMKKTM